MSKSARYLVNAIVCLAVGVYALYWFAAGRAASAPSLSIGLAVAGAVVGLGGAVWFYSRSRSAAS